MNTHSSTSAEDSMTLGGLPSVIGDENEYVFVDSDDDDEFDDDEYDHITDLSPVISCDGSVATELTDLKSLIDEGVAMVNNSDNSVNTAATFSTGANKPSGRRVSNKKRRKMIKMMKKAAAAEKAKKALEAQLAREMSSSTSSDETTGGAGSRRTRRSRSNSGGSSYKERKARASNNFQVACAQQALAAFRKEAEEANNVC